MSATSRRILLIREGLIRTPGNSIQPCRPPCIVLAPIGFLIRVDEQARGSLIMIDRKTEDELLGQAHANGQFRSVLSQQTTTSFRADPSELSELEAIATDLAGELEIRRTAFEIIAMAKLSELIALVCRLHTDQSTGPTGVWDMDRVMEYVREHYDEAFSLTEISSRCALSPASFSREFKRIAGCPLFEFINKVRIQKACSLLKHSNASVTAIAMDVGYNNVSFFNRYFRKTIGMAPTEYRSVAKR